MEIKVTFPYILREGNFQILRAVNVQKALFFIAIQVL